jgi:hypothetical protein
MKRLIIFNFLCFSFIIFNSCKKPAGEGGSSSIKGKIWVKDYNKSFLLIHEYAGVDVEVYIIFGDETVHGEKVNTNANGEFEFKYLRKGSYKIYAISEEQIGNSNDVKDEAIVVNSSISKNKSSVDVGTITIKR